MRCKDIADEYAVTAMQVGRLRKRLFPDHKGGELSEDEINAITEYYESLEDIDTRKEMEKAVESRYVIGYVSYVQRGRREVECRIRGANNSIETIYALIPTGVDPASILGTTIKLETIDHNDKQYYRHASLANVAWPTGYGSNS